MTDKRGRSIQIWDLPLRVFHWGLVMLIAAAWWTAEHGDMAVHQIIGLCVAGLLVFRVWWGLAGGAAARFSQFVRGPKSVARYMKTLFKPSASPAVLGHNPMGGWSVVALLSLLVAEVGLGLFSVDVDGEVSGPFADRVSFDVGRLAAHGHHLAFNGLLVLIALHLCAVAFYALVKRDNLVGPMITGSKRADPAVVALSAPLQRTPTWRFWAGVALGIGVAVALARGFRL